MRARSHSSALSIVVLQGRSPIPASPIASPSLLRDQRRRQEQARVGDDARSDKSPELLRLEGRTGRLPCRRLLLGRRLLWPVGLPSDASCRARLGDIECRPITAHFLFSAMLVTYLPEAHRRFGIARVTQAGLPSRRSASLLGRTPASRGSCSPRHCRAGPDEP